MKLATVRLNLNGELAVATLEDGKWSVPGRPLITEFLDSTCSPSNFGPADGDPVVLAATRAMESFDGSQITFVRATHESPDVVY